jgi:hypothetical protein
MAPAYTLGHAWSLGAVAICFCLWWVLRHIYYRREAQKEILRQGGGGGSSEELFSDRSPEYRYQH